MTRPARSLSARRIPAPLGLFLKWHCVRLSTQLWHHLFLAGGLCGHRRGNPLPSTKSFRRWDSHRLNCLFETGRGERPAARKQPPAITHVASTPENIAAVLARRAPGATRIGLERGLLSTWHWHALKALGLPVVCLDARHVKAALSLWLDKTDANHAGLAQIVRTGWYRQVQVRSLDSHLIRTLLAAHAGLLP